MHIWGGIFFRGDVPCIKLIKAFFVDPPSVYELPCRPQWYLIRPPPRDSPPPRAKRLKIHSQKRKKHGWLFTPPGDAPESAVEKKVLATRPDVFFATRVALSLLVALFCQRAFPSPAPLAAARHQRLSCLRRLVCVRRLIGGSASVDFQSPRAFCTPFTTHRAPDTLHGWCKR